MAFNVALLQVQLKKNNVILDFPFGAISAGVCANAHFCHFRSFVVINSPLLTLQPQQKRIKGAPAFATKIRGLRKTVASEADIASRNSALQVQEILAQ